MARLGKTDKTSACHGRYATLREEWFSAYSIEAWGAGRSSISTRSSDVERNALRANPRDGCRVLAVIQPLSRRARLWGDSDPFGVAAAETGRLAGERQPAADRGGTGGGASLCESRLSLGRCRLDRASGEAPETRINTSVPWEAKERRAGITDGMPVLSIYARSGGWHLFNPSQTSPRQPSRSKRLRYLADSRRDAYTVCRHQ